jgi:hypothetical protein
VTLGAIQPSVPVLVAGALALFAWWGALVSFRNEAKTRRATDRLRADREFVKWASWTTVAIVDAEGRVYHRTLYDLQDEPEDLIWDSPKSAIIFRAGPEEPDPYGFHLERGDDGRPE